jgi:hypothetical protein
MWKVRRRVRGEPGILITKTEARKAKSPTIAKTARMGHPTSKAKANFKSKLQKQTSKAKANFKGKVNFEGKGDGACQRP